MPLSHQEQEWLDEFEPLTDIELRQLAAKPQGAFEATEKAVFAGLVLADREARKRDSREEETLSIAKEANRIAAEARDSAKRQSFWTFVAAISAIIAAIAAIAPHTRAILNLLL